MNEVTIEEVRAVLAQSLGLEGEAAAGMNLRDVSAVDSVAMIEFVVAIEKKFGVTIEEDWLDQERLLNLPALADYIGRRRGRTD